MSKLKDRLADAMMFANMNATELAYKTKIPKASISQYLSGYASPNRKPPAKALPMVWPLSFNSLIYP